MTWVLIAAGGLVGAPVRFLLDRAVSRRRPSAFPLGTVLVNVLGCAAIGALAHVAVHTDAGLVYAALGTGFCGGFTTFSTFTWETLALFEDGMPVLAVINVSASLVLGLGAAAVTYALS